ncbi:Rha family transcriptional regulator [Pseudomonas sp. LSJ-87]|uniref:Rha family transcriptional regulator n=1 Tax=Pseudomonas sp. LSJ-87 TaxID=3079932 RepID=UPI0029411F2F|nr:Rha family transcriptional regulator [Pseudomonas sp. LSJ-87]MDV5100738.1 Rha family transcriptional regulator [Pseudomonas sp. LSJ-87]
MTTTATDATVFENITRTEVIGLTTLNGLPGMTSLEIAEITGKNHKHVLRDIAKMVEALESRGPDLDRQIVSTQYVDSRGKLQPLTILDKRRTFVLLSRYSFELSDLIVARWLELEDSGFLRVSVKESVIHLAEREKDNRNPALRQINRGRQLSPQQKERARASRQASTWRDKLRKAGNPDWEC